MFEAIIFFLIEKGTYAEIYEDCLIIMVDHYVVRLDVSMNNFYRLMAIEQSLKHVYEIELYILRLQPNLLIILGSTLILTLLLEGFVGTLDVVAETTHGVVFLNNIYVVLLRIINNLFQPNHIRVLEFLQNLQLFFYKLVDSFLSQSLFVHLLDGVHHVSLRVLT